MVPQLPTELIELVVEQVSANPRTERLPALASFSLASRNFVDLCQRSLFRSVRLWTHRPDANGVATRETVDFNRRALLLAHTLVKNPTLGTYVQSLDYRVTSDPELDRDPDLDIILRALHSMPNVVKFHFGSRISRALGKASMLSFQDSLTTPAIVSKWRERILSISSLPQLKTLSLENVIEFPVAGMSPGIQSLKFSTVHLTPGTRSSSALPSLKTFRCDPMSLYYLANRYLGPTEDSSLKLDLSRLDTLHMEVAYLSQDHISRPLLSTVTHLRELEISVGRTSNSGDMPGPGRPPSPLRHIHSASHCTLSRLKINMNVRFGKGTTYLRDPYACMAEDALLHLVALEHMEFNFMFPGHLSLEHPRNLQWDQLPEVLGRPGALPRLRRVIIHIVLNGPCSRPRTRMVGPVQACDIQAAQRLSEEFYKLVYTDQFCPLLAVRPDLDLSFDTEVSI